MFLVKAFMLFHFFNNALCERRRGDVEQPSEQSTINATVPNFTTKTDILSSTNSTSYFNGNTFGINESTFKRGLIVFAALSGILIIYFGIRTYRCVQQCFLAFLRMCL